MKKINIADTLLLDDPSFIAFNKPTGRQSQSGKKDPSSLHLSAEEWCGHPLKVIHRIDRPASGILIYAKNKRAAMELSKQWKKRTIVKKYLAVTLKSKRFQKGKMEDLLWHNKKKNKSYAVEHKDDGAKEAILRYQTLGEIDHYQLMEIELITGRHHQIRCQLGNRNIPIKGDTKYGAKRGNRDKSIHLHAWKLCFTHPETQEQISLQAAPNLEDAVWSTFAQSLPNYKLDLTRAYS